MAFWIIAGALALVATGIMAMSVMRRRDSSEHPAAFDLRVYRDQLKEVDKDLARGVIEPGDAERIRTEISRRILAADAQLQAEQSGQSKGARGAMPLIVILGVVTIGASVFLYTQLGAPGYGDIPLNVRKEDAREKMETRQSQSKAEAEVPATPGRTPDPEFA